MNHAEHQPRAAEPHLTDPQPSEPGDDEPLGDRDDLVRVTTEVITDIRDNYPRRPDDAPSEEVAEAVVARVQPEIEWLRRDVQQTAVQCWDECAQYAADQGIIYKRGLNRLLAENPYRDDDAQ